MGRLFHTFGAAFENALLPKVFLALALLSNNSMSSFDLKLYRDTFLTSIRMFKYFYRGFTINTFIHQHGNRKIN